MDEKIMLSLICRIHTPNEMTNDNIFAISLEAIQIDPVHCVFIEYRIINKDDKQKK